MSRKNHCLALCSFLAFASCARSQSSHTTEVAKLRASVEQLEESQSSTDQAITKLTAELANLQAALEAQTNTTSDTTAAPPLKIESGEVTQVAEREFKLKRSLLKRVLGSPASADRIARVVPGIKDGTFAGYKLYAIREGSLLASLGFRNGDRVTKINDESLTWPPAPEVFEKLGSPDVVIIHLVRRGKTLTQTVHLVD